MDQELFNNRLNVLVEKLSVLPDKEEETPTNTLKALWSCAAGNPVSVSRANTILLEDLTPDQTRHLDDMLEKRMQGMPLAYITGRQSFMDIELLATKDALIPRKETEILASTAIRVAKEFLPAKINVIDTCTGAGNVALAIAKYCEHATVYAADLSEDAARLAKENADFVGLGKRVSFYSGDLLQPFEKLDLNNNVNILTCNPPYISTAKVSDMPVEISAHEPKLAFDGGAFGINLIKRLVTEADKFIQKNGYLIFEVGYGQAAMIKKLVEKTNIYNHVETMNDAAGHPRVIVARK